MSPSPFLPIPPELFARACRTVSSRVSQLPFLRGGVSVTGEMVGVVMECLNAVPTRSLALSAPQRGTDAGTDDGIDRCLEERLHIAGNAAAPVIADVLCSAGITEPALIPDRQARRERRGIRLAAPWTWHIASALAPSVRLGGGSGDDPNLSWLDICPVCRTGFLERVTGKQLFGIPRTDFYIECSHCGAKFIPVGPAFRLVSIATIRDPLWKKHLDKTYPAETWAALARGPSPGASPAPRPAVKKPAGTSLPPPVVTLAALKDGSLAVPVGGKTLYFRPISLNYSGSTREDAFARVQATLADLLARPAYEHLRQTVNARYSRYLTQKAGLFLGQLKERHDPFYREFLNQYGDEKYGTFRAEEMKETEKSGVILVVVNRGLYHAENSAGPLRTTINNRLGRIGPDDCLLDGDPARCRINALLCTNKKEAGFYFRAEDNDNDREAVAAAIIALLSPPRE